MIVRHGKRVMVLCALIVLAAAFGPLTVPARAAAPLLWLPTPLGEEWKIIQGFYCGTHTGGLARALDLASAGGRTYDAPVRAAADGTVFVWDARSGTIILSHGDGYYTEYTHLKSPTTTRSGTHFKQGDVIGRVGTIGTGNNPHLHFVFFRADGPYAANRRGLELDFADGYSFHDSSGCNQHYGTRITARGPDETPPVVEFTSIAEENQWQCKDERIEFAISDETIVEGFSQSFHEAPPDDGPIFPGDAGYANLAWADKEGMHTLYVRAWDVHGNHSLASYGPVGYDASPPTLEAPASVPVKTYSTGNDIKLQWQPADDGDGAGVQGYKLYLGTDPEGTSDWFSEEPEVTLPTKAPGRYYFRVQALDDACWSSDWVTLQVVVVQGTDGEDTLPDTSETPEPTATPTATPTTAPTEEATPTPTEAATEEPTEAATEAATPTPTEAATEEPTEAATEAATATPTEEPTEAATEAATATPTEEPTEAATEAATEEPTATPTRTPTPTGPTPEPDIVLP